MRVHACAYRDMHMQVISAKGHPVVLTEGSTLYTVHVLDAGRRNDTEARRPGAGHKDPVGTARKEPSHAHEGAAHRSCDTALARTSSGVVVPGCKIEACRDSLRNERSGGLSHDRGHKRHARPRLQSTRQVAIVWRCRARSPTGDGVRGRLWHRRQPESTPSNCLRCGTRHGPRRAVSRIPQVVFPAQTHSGL